MLDGLLAQAAIALFATVSVGGIAYALLGGKAEARTKQRIRSVSDQQGVKREKDQKARRQKTEDVLKDIERRAKNSRKLTLEDRIKAAGLDWSKQRFLTISAIAGVAAAALALILGAPLWLGPVLLVVVGLGIPRWILGFRKARREKKFLEEFGNSIEVIVRGAKAGLPIIDCMKIVATESAEPVRSEFRIMVETQALGIPLPDCAERMFRRMPLPEVSFFAIVLQIQQRSGGNLTEILQNLANVLRDRKKLKAKVVAMSQEAKASAMIIGALPFVVMTSVGMTSPDYISLMWTTPAGQLMMMGSAFWMLCGILVMRQMINFDF
ncbi:MAG: type II secretion system F family protein [Pseudomonadota bacterium]